MAVAVYPGTFDPFTRGHEDLVRRASSIFGEVIVGVADSRSKKPFFNLEERIAIAKEVLNHFSNVKIVGFTGLLKDLPVSIRHGSSSAVCAPYPILNMSFKWQV